MSRSFVICAALIWHGAEAARLSRRSGQMTRARPGMTAAPDFPIMAGLNIPWNHFGYDIGGNVFNASWFEEYFALAEKNKQNIARFWVHCDGARAGLVYGKNGNVEGLSPTFTKDIQQLLSIAQKHSVVVQLCLWSFDMCKDHLNVGSTKAYLASNEAASVSYVHNALNPMLDSMKDFPNVIIEVINEPEWCMKGPGNTKDIVEVTDMQRFVAMIADASHAKGRKVTVGSASLKWSSHASEAEASYWDDVSLRKAYSSSNGTLDFYNVHYYDWMHNDQWGYDPMRANTDHWQLDRPTVVAELPAESQFYSFSDMLDKSTGNGFYGALFWAYNDPGHPIGASAYPALSSYATSHGATYGALLKWLSSPTPPPKPSTCTDELPAGSQQYTCAQQKSWGKCSQSWMKGFCCKTCFNCAASCGK